MTPGKACIICGRTAKQVGIRKLNWLDQTCSICRPSIKGATARQRYKTAHPDRIAASQDRYQRSDRGRAKQARRRAVESHKISQRAWHVRKLCGITLDQWAAAFELQGSACGICKRVTPDAWHGKWCTDHDHETRKFRGILCDKCNRKLGFLGDNLTAVRELYERISTYLGGS